MTRSRTITEAKAASSFSEDELAHLPSKQTWEVLTNLLYRTVLPLAKTTTFAIDILFTILTSTSDQRRKISIFDSEKCLSMSYDLLFKSPETIMRNVIFDMGVERWVISNFVNNYLEGTYRPKQIQTEDGYYFSQEAMRRHVRDMYAIYNNFRQRVCERFTKLSNSQAAKNRWQKEQFGLTSDQGDNENNYFLSVIRAIDKLYPSKGTLANYVMLWLSNSAGSTFTIYTGEAFNLSRPVRKEIHEGRLAVNNKAYDLEGAINIPAPEDSAIAVEDTSLIAEVIASAQKIPEASLTMLLHGFKHIPTPELVDDLRRHMIEIEGINDFEDYLHLPEPDVEDIPMILPLSRASRKNTESQRRRKEALKMRKENA